MNTPPFSETQQPPDSLEVAVSQAIAACFSAIERSTYRLVVDLRFPELRQMPIAYQFARALTERYGDRWQGIFPDAGAAALAQRDWSDIPIKLRGVNEGRRLTAEDKDLFLLIAPSSVELEQVEKLAQLVSDRPLIMLNPQLENMEVGIGLATRRMRERFLNTFETAYYLQPLEAGFVWRCYPQTWQVWAEGQCLRELLSKPTPEELQRIFAPQTGKKFSFLDQLQTLFNFLNR
ncbi:MAG: DUF1995 family protein [Pseudanabaenaceae cyanobacterium SKYGB_i_bin29]|nr:DUF1995 family protein [Pseudanabaenaceae cyanobacterium SKYG29]MDW8422641.1 DUF1995 family protein [Pseudanabaenaceae cyanobacterium SKYGB_i_bin29]